jgi:hypothetical protein
VEQPMALRMTGTPAMYTSSLRRSMDLSKPQEHGMNVLEISLFLMLSRPRKLILLFSLRLAMVICLYAKYMCNTPNFFGVEFFFFSSLSKFGCYLSFPFLFAKTSTVFKTLSYVIIVNPRVNFFDLLHHAEPCIFWLFENVKAFI